MQEPLVMRQVQDSKTHTHAAQHTHTHTRSAEFVDYGSLQFGCQNAGKHTHTHTHTHSFIKLRTHAHFWTIASAECREPLVMGQDADAHTCTHNTT